MQVSTGISGSEGMVVCFAGCCSPLPGDPIVGVLPQREGMVVHTSHCRRVAHLPVDGLQAMLLHWEDKVSGLFRVGVALSLVHRIGMLAQVTSTIAEVKADIEKLTSQIESEHTVLIKFQLSVLDCAHVMRVINRLQSLASVHWVKRLGADDA